MDVFKKLKSVFIVEDESSRANAEVQIPTSDDSVGIPTLSSDTATPAPKSTFDASALQGKAPDSKFMDILFEAIQAANLDGFDYLEFKTTLQSLAKMNMDDATKYQSAIAMAQSNGVNAEKIIQAANHYLAILKEENSKFSGAVKAQNDKLSQDQTEGLSALKKSIAEKKAQIEQLQKEIAAQEKQLADMGGQLTQTANKIAETSAKFNQAYTAVTQQIVDDIKNISKYSGKA